MTTELTTIGLFAGIGGIEYGLERAGYRTDLLCEIDPAAAAVLRTHFPGSVLYDDVRTLGSIPKVDVLSAGFPCQDLSQAGRKVGIEGSQSSLVGEVFRLCRNTKTQPDWIVLENVSYMLRLDRGQAMTALVSELELLGYSWAYRVVDARSFGVPQRRQRVLLVASRRDDPRGVLFADESSGPDFDDAIGAVAADAWYGFYWTEGLRGLGWAKNAVPTVKGGSKLGIPSPPAVWNPDDGSFGTPELEDAERLQGFESGWTAPGVGAGERPGARWRLVGNAVCVPMAEWLGRRLAEPGESVVDDRPMTNRERWPNAAWGSSGQVYAVEASMRPFDSDVDLRSFLQRPLRPLSLRAASGFLSRAERGNLRFADGFLEDLQQYVIALEGGQLRIG